MSTEPTTQLPASPPLSSSDLLGATVEIDMIGWGGKWLVVKDEGGAKVWVNRPQNLRPRWVMRRYIKAPNARTQRRGAKYVQYGTEMQSSRPLECDS
jgi:hypothetical protein